MTNSQRHPTPFLLSLITFLLVAGSLRAEERFVSPNSFDGTDVARINQAIEAASRQGLRVVIPRHNEGRNGDLWLLDSAILVRDNTTLELDNCHIKLSDRCRDNMIRSANCGLGVTDIRPMKGVHIYGVGNVLLEGADHPRATGDSAKTLGKRSYGTDAGVKGESQTGDWRNIGILLAEVEHFSIRNIHVKDAHCWAISLERCGFGRVCDIHFTAEEHRMIDGTRETILNQDGLDLRQGCHDVSIERLSGQTGDDLLALTNINHAAAVAGTDTSTMVSAANRREGGVDDIRNIFIRQIVGHSHGGHHVVRFPERRRPENIQRRSGRAGRYVPARPALQGDAENRRCESSMGRRHPRRGHQPAPSEQHLQRVSPHHSHRRLPDGFHHLQRRPAHTRWSADYVRVGPRVRQERTDLERGACGPALTGHVRSGFATSFQGFLAPTPCSTELPGLSSGSMRNKNPYPQPAPGTSINANA